MDYAYLEGQVQAGALFQGPILIKPLISHNSKWFTTKYWGRGKEMGFLYEDDYDV